MPFLFCVYLSLNLTLFFRKFAFWQWWIFKHILLFILFICLFVSLFVLFWIFAQSPPINTISRFEISFIAYAQTHAMNFDYFIFRWWFIWNGQKRVRSLSTNKQHECIKCKVRILEHGTKSNTSTYLWLAVQISIDFMCVDGFFDLFVDLQKKYRFWGNTMCLTCWRNVQIIEHIANNNTVEAAAAAINQNLNNVHAQKSKIIAKFCAKTFLEHNI